MPKTVGQSISVVTLLYDELCTFEFATASGVFGEERPEIAEGLYTYTTCSEERRPIHAVGGVELLPAADLCALANADTVVVPGWNSNQPTPTPAVREAMTAAWERGARMIAICTGAFLFAELGILDGLSATTHWAFAEKFHKRYPHIDLHPEVLYIDNKKVLTSAGSAAGVDLLLHVVRKDYGVDIANAIARRLVLPPHRDGGQLQFIDAPIPRVGDAKLSELLAAIQANPGAAWSLSDMAAACAMSVRTFARKFERLTGISPGEWVIQERIRAAKAGLEAGGESVDEIASRVGFGSPENFTRAFRKRVGVSPRQYRVSFCPSGEARCGETPLA